MATPIRPNTVLTLFFKGGGSVVIQTPYSKEKIRALMNPDRGEKVKIMQTTSITEVHQSQDPRSPILWTLEEEEIVIERFDEILFWNIQVGKEPSPITLINPQGIIVQ